MGDTFQRDSRRRHLKRPCPILVLGKIDNINGHTIGRMPWIVDDPERHATIVFLSTVWSVSLRKPMKANQ